MLPAGHRMGIIVGMWMAMAVGLFGVAIYGSESGRDVGWLFVLAILLPAFTTLILSGALPGFSFRTSTQEKTKRQPDAKLALLLELMDEDERMAFKESLKQRVLDSASDGELPMELLGAIDEATSRAGKA